MLGHDDQTNAIMCDHFEKVQEVNQCPHAISTSALISASMYTSAFTVGRR